VADAPTDTRLKGRRALVTGGSTGIGRATCLRLAADGAAVAVNYIGPADPANDLVGEIAGAGGHAIAIAADVSDEQQVIAMFADASGQLGGPIDLLVNNAGVEHPYELIDMPLAEFNRVLSINLTGGFLCARETAKALRAKDAPGVIVNVSSVHEEIPWRMFSHYCASKGGLRMFSKTIAYELAPHGIRVVSVAPGAILTPINQNLIDDPKQAAAVIAEIPEGRLGKPEEIAAAISWLASDEADYITGTTLFVDGGMTLYPKFV
jgi:glucose 1-dehydrogenase